MLHLKQLKHGYISVRFTQWTRKSYAAFASLKLQVTMGHVAKDITEKALLKNKKNNAKVVKVDCCNLKQNLKINISNLLDKFIEKLNQDLIEKLIHNLIKSIIKSCSTNSSNNNITYNSAETFDHDAVYTHYGCTLNKTASIHLITFTNTFYNIHKYIYGWCAIVS